MNVIDAKKKVAADLGISGLPASFQDEIISSLGETVLNQVSRSVFDQVPEKAYAEFEKISNSGDSTALAQFLSNYIPNIDSFVKKEMRRTIDEFRTFAKAEA